MVFGQLTLWLMTGFAFLHRRTEMEQRAHATAPAREASGNGKLHALIVEDDPINQKITGAQLAALGISAEVVEDGESALDALAGRRYDLVLMDCHLPGIDGYETTRRLRGQEKERRLPVIAVTSNTSWGERERCLAAGMDEYLAKPFRLEELSALLGQVLPRS